MKSMAAQVQEMRPSRTPTDKVLEMRSQQLSNNQIIQILQRDGYELPSIFNAMNQADIKGGVESASLQSTEDFPPPQDAGGPMMQQQQFSEQMQQQGYPQQETQDSGMPDYSQMQQMPAPEQYSQQPMQMQQQQPLPAFDYPAQQQQQYAPSATSFEAQRIEELAEAIIDEKWNEIVRSINKIIDWKERVESRVTKIEQQIDDMSKNFDTLQKGVLGKITDYDRNLTNVGAEIKAMDKVFQKVLPSLTENVSELSRITAGMRKK